jgi:dihydroorotase
MKFLLPAWTDLHTHLRQDGLLAPIVQSQLDMGCAGVLAMPNTKPPVAKVFDSDSLPYASIEDYTRRIRAAGGDRFTHLIVPLYLTKDTTPAMIEAGAKSDILKACKYYPPHGTTGADFGAPLQHYIDNGVFKAMADCGVILCVHGEEHHMEPEHYFGQSSNAEEVFYKERLPHVLDQSPDLKIACEHITTQCAVDFVQSSGVNIAASVTPQHILYTVGHLLKGLQYHLYCLPLLKFAEDRAAIRQAITKAGQTKFYAGTDSAAHTKKATECGCAAGCFTGGIAPQLYAQGFEEAGVDLSTAPGQEIFKAFLCDNGPRYYGFAPAQAPVITLEKTPQRIAKIETLEEPITPLPLGLGLETIPWSLKLVKN